MSCSQGGRARIVRVGLRGEGKPPRSVEVNCPVCRASHPVDLSWRQPVAADEGVVPELLVESGGQDGKGR